MQAISGRQLAGAAFVCLVSLAASGQSAVLTVDPQDENAFQTIQDALDAAAVGDTVQLADGTYTGDGNVSLAFHFRAITLCSMNGPANCIVDCQGRSLAGAPRGVVKGITVLNSAEIFVDSDRLALEDCVFQAPSPASQPMLYLSGCRPTIVNCTFRGFAGVDGGAIQCVRASPIVRRCTFENNFARQDGGAIHNRFGSPVITQCRFVNNSCKDDGGAIANYDASHPMIVACTFEQNRSNDNGGAIFSRSGSCPRIVSCVFAGNRARAHGGAIYSRENAAAIVNCVFTGNSAHNNGGALYCTQTNEPPSLLNCTLVGNIAELEGGAVYCENRGGPSLLNCIVWANQDETGTSETSQIFATQRILRHCCVQNWTGQLGDATNLDGEPQFVDADGSDNIAGTADDNFRLTGTSPCVNAGSSEMLSDPFLTDCDGYPRIMGTLVDIGAYEYVVPPEVVATETPTYPRLDEDVVVINEARTWSPEGAYDWIELRNVTDRQVHVGGWQLSDEVSPGLYEIASGTFIEPYGYLMLYEDKHFGDPADPGCVRAFALNREGETLHLRSAYCGLPTGLRQDQALEYFVTVGDSDTLGRHTKSDGTADFVRLSVPTPGADNAYPWIGPVVVSEIIRHQDALGRIWAYIELYNGSTFPAQVEIQIGSSVASSATVPAQGRVLIADRPDLMQSVYGSILPPGVEILHTTTYLGSLGYGTAVTLGQGLVTYDRVCLRHDWLGLDSWPTTAEGEALAAIRVDLTGYGNDPDNWQAAPASPGR